MLSATNFHDFLISSCNYGKKVPVLAAVSGGLDSVVLCNLLHKNQIPFAIAHVNFGLRGTESDEDEIFVSELAKKLNVPFYLKRCTTETFKEAGENSTQVAARKIRYDFFQLICSQNGFEEIAVAHHKDDSIETALLNFARGTGLKGLTGIHAKNGNVIRPLLFASRKDIREYALEQSIAWREDSSNESDKYNRNRFRHHLLPYLMAEIPQAYSGFDASFKRIEEAESLLEASLEFWKNKCCNISEKEIKISIEEAKQFQKPEFFLLFFLRKFGFKEMQSETVHSILSAESGVQFFSNSHRLIRDREFIFLIKNKSYSENSRTALFSINEESFSGEIPDDKWTVLIDADSVKLPFEIRTWKHGDKMIPFGMSGHRNVSDILNELKMPLHKKEMAKVIVNGDEIVWIPGYRIAEKFRIKANTTSVLRLHFNSENHGD